MHIARPRIPEAQAIMPYWVEYRILWLVVEVLDQLVVSCYHAFQVWYWDHQLGWHQANWADGVFPQDWGDAWPG